VINSSMPNLFADDVEATALFYRDQLGFSESSRVPREGRPEHVVLQLGESQLALSTPRAVNAVGLRPSTGNSFELIVWCHDVDTETARLRADGVTIVVDPYHHVGGHRRAYITDPDGNWVALVDTH